MQLQNVFRFAKTNSILQFTTRQNGRTPTMNESKQFVCNINWICCPTFYHCDHLIQDWAFLVCLFTTKCDFSNNCFQFQVCWVSSSKLLDKKSRHFRLPFFLVQCNLLEDVLTWKVNHVVKVSIVGMIYQLDILGHNQFWNLLQLLTFLLILQDFWSFIFAL